MLIRQNRLTTKKALRILLFLYFSKLITIERKEAYHSISLVQ